MRRAIATTVLLLALLAGCSNLNKKERKRVESNDAAPMSDGGAATVAPATVEEIVTLFHHATGGTPHPAIDRLRQVIRTQPADVAAAALAVMAEPRSMTDAGPGQEAMFYLDRWLDTKPDEEARKRMSVALERVIAEGSSNMRRSAYTFLAERRLPDAERILIAEVENPARGVGERGAAGSALGAVIDDFSLIKRWLSDDQPLHWAAALNAMDSFDPEGREQREAEERALVIALGKRPDLPGDAVYDLASYYETYLGNDPNDAEIRALAERWSKHPDGMAASQMRKILVGYPPNPLR